MDLYAATLTEYVLSLQLGAFIFPGNRYTEAAVHLGRR